MDNFNIYELYHNTLKAEKPLVVSICSNIKFRVQEAIALGETNKIIFDTNVFLQDSNIYVRDRVIDQVVKYLRSNGIRVRTQGTPGTVTPTQTTTTQEINGEFDTSFSIDFMVYEEATVAATEWNSLLFIEWHIRSKQEFMKHYC